MSHGKRYSAKERKDILKYLETHTYQETVDKYGVSEMSLARWVKNKTRRETNTQAPLLDKETQREFQIYLNLIESGDKINAVAVVTAAGELLLPETNGFGSIFRNVNDVSKITANFLLCAQGFTAGVMNDQKQKDVKFDDISINTPIGTFSISEVGKAVLVVLFSLDCSKHDILIHDSHILSKIKVQMKKILM
jgi:hypothetical protein